MENGAVYLQKMKQYVANKNNQLKLYRLLYILLKQLGYNKTAQSLLSQSKIVLPQIIKDKIVGKMKNKQYLQVFTQLKQLQINQNMYDQACQTLYQLEINRLMSKGEVNKSIQLIADHVQNKTIQTNLFNYLVLGRPLANQQIINTELKIKEICERIIKINNNLQNLFHIYLQKDTYMRSNKILQQKTKIPNKLVATSGTIKNKLDFIKVSDSLNRICGVCQTKNSYNIYCWVIQNKQIKLLFELPAAKNSRIVDVKWMGQTQKVIVASTNTIDIFNTDHPHQVQRIELKTYNIDKLLSVQVRNMELVLTGLFQGIVKINHQRQVKRLIALFFKIRSISYGQADILYAISATKGQLIKFNQLFQKIQHQFIDQYCFMDVKYASQKVIVSNKANIFILKSLNLQKIHTIKSPQNNCNWKIQVNIFHNWIVYYGQTLEGYNIKTKKVHTWQKYETIDVSNKYICTFNKNLQLFEEQYENVDIQLDAQIKNSIVINPKQEQTQITFEHNVRNWFNESQNEIVSMWDRIRLRHDLGRQITLGMRVQLVFQPQQMQQELNQSSQQIQQS